MPVEVMPVEVIPVEVIPVEEIPVEEMSIGLNAMSDMLISQAELMDKQNKFLSVIVYDAALELNPYSSDALEAIAIHYEIKKKNFERAEEYYLRAIECDDKNTRILFNFADFWKDKDCEKMIYYFNLAVENGDICSMFRLAKLYLSNNNNERFLEYYIMAQDLLCEEEVRIKYEKKNDFTIKISNFKLLEIIEGIQNPSPKIKKFISNLISIQDISFYKNKVRLFTKLNNICECQICLEDKLNIDLHCGHEVCIDCYKKVYEGDCPFCRATSYFDKCEIDSDLDEDDDYDEESESEIEIEIEDTVVVREIVAESESESEAQANLERIEPSYRIYRSTTTTNTNTNTNITSVIFDGIRRISHSNILLDMINYNNSEMNEID